MPGLERRLKAEIAGGADFGRFTRGRYATDASIYQVQPVGVVVWSVMVLAAVAMLNQATLTKCAVRFCH